MNSKTPTLATKQTRAMKVKCPTCSAPKGEPCTGPRGGRRSPHGERYRWERQLYRDRLKQARNARRQRGRRMEGVTVRFECPVCGGDHSRADHARSNGTDMISKALAS